MGRAKRRGRPRRPAAIRAAIERERAALREKREIALLKARVRKLDIERRLREQGIALSHTTISNVVAGVHRNADVERAFCELTGTTADEMFPPQTVVVARDAAAG